MKTLVIRATRLEEVLSFFQTLGLEFVKEKHGSGPEHYACERNGVVFEIYPSRKNDSFVLRDYVTNEPDQYVPAAQVPRDEWQ